MKIQTIQTEIETIVNKIVPAVITAVFLTVSLAGCLGSPVKVSTPGEAAVSEPSFAPEPAVEEEADLSNLTFGSAATYVDNVSISVSTPAAFTPGEYAAGDDQAAQVVFSFTITNGSEENLEPYTYTEVSSGGVEASSIFDSGNAVGELLGGPSTVILPGGTITWMEAFSVADPNNIILQVSPGFEYTDAIFTNVQ